MPGFAPAETRSEHPPGWDTLTQSILLSPASYTRGDPRTAKIPKKSTPRRSDPRGVNTRAFTPLVNPPLNSPLLLSVNG
jgi:hypothetical protein